ncbi:MAG TPA: hypothetical protein VIV40_09965 [Kofleriaceae bacterium]
MITTLLLAACGGAARPAPQSPGSRGPHASEHLTAAREHDEAARERAMWPDTRTSDGTGRVDQMLIGSSWHRTWDTAADQERAAAVHRSEAQAIYTEYQEACGDRATKDVSVSPIVKYGVGGNPTKDGVVLYLSSEAGPPERLMADLKCHRAWMRIAPANMEICPLDLAGLQVDAKGSPDGITLTLTVSDPKLIPELQRRAAADLEVGSTHAHRH